MKKLSLIVLLVMFLSVVCFPQQEGEIKVIKKSGELVS